MKMSNCPQLWKVEAVRDRRLIGSEAAAFDRHLALCARCSAEVSTLRTLSSLLTSLPVPEIDPMSARRMRQQLLEDANTVALGLRPAEPRPKRLFPAFAGAATFVAAAAALAAVIGHLHKAPPVASLSASPPALSIASGEPSRPGPLFAEIWSTPNTRWSRRTEASIEHIQLDQGMLTVRTSHEKGAAQLSFEMPDGRLVDRGTTFEVQVENGHTERVRVTEGSVAVRLDERPEFIVNAGQSWTRGLGGPSTLAPTNSAPASAPEPSPVAAVAAVKGASAPFEIAPKRTASSPAASRPSARSERSSAHEAKEAREPKENDAEPRAASAESEEAPRCVASKSMDTGLALLAANHYQAAASAFGRFTSTCANDPRAEDAAYLRVVAHARAGDTEQAREAAHSYLARFPHGFRRTEVEKLVASP